MFYCVVVLIKSRCRSFFSDIAAHSSSSNAAATTTSNVKLKDQELLQRSAELDDPCKGVPKERLEKDQRICRGPYQPRISCYPEKTIGKGVGARKRSFKSNWFDKYKWLEYSISKDAAYCFPCRFFSLHDSSRPGTIEGAFTATGFCSWHKATQKFDLHQDSKCHSSSVNSWERFQKNRPIDVALDEAKKTELKEKEKQRLKNHEYMSRLVDTIRLLAKGGRPLRGHNEGEGSHEKGLFLEIVSLLKKYDPFFKTYNENAPKHCTYLSNHIQNDILASLSTVILRTISDEVRGQPMAIIGDETSDVSHHEQLSIVFRYIPNGETHPVERLVALKRVKKTDAETIFNALDMVLNQVGVLWRDVVSVCFDGASAMAGEFTGVQARCKEVNPSIMYVHCYAHCLNLALVSACTSHKENPIVFDFFGVVQVIFNFIEGSPKRHAVFEEIVKQTDAKLKTLKSLSDTRWACRSEAVSVIHAQFEAITKAIEECTESGSDAKARAKGKGLLLQVKSYNFIACLQIMHPILQLVVKVSKTLQNPNMDLCQAMDDIEGLASALVEMRNDNEVFEEIFTKTNEMCSKIEIDIPAPKKRKVSVLLEACSRADSAFYVESKNEELRLFTFYPVLDSLVQGLHSRFSQETKNVISAVGKLMGLNLGSKKCETSDFQILAVQFGVDVSELEAEFKLLKCKKGDNGDSNFPPKTVPEWLHWLGQFQRGATYDSFTTVMTKFATMPVTSCTSERSFSKLTVVKSKLRTTMLQERLEHLMIPFLEQELADRVSTESIINEFKSMVPFNRRMSL